MLGLTVLLTGAAPAPAQPPLNPDPPPAGAITGKFLMVFQACDPSAAGSSCPMSLGGTRDYLVQSNDGVSWSLVPNWPAGSPPIGGYSPVACGGPCGPGSPTIIRRGDEFYLYVGLVGSSGSALLRYHISTGRWDAPVEVATPAGLTVGEHPAGQPCTRLIGSATEVAGSDGGRFTWNGDNATVPLSPPASGMSCDNVADPAVISAGGQFLLFFSGYGGASTAVWSSPSLLGTYQPVSTLPADSGCTSVSAPPGELDNGPGGVPSAYFDPAGNQYWLYVTTRNPSSVVSRAVFSGFASPLTSAAFNPVVTQASMGFSSSTTIANADFKANLAGTCGTSVCGSIAPVPSVNTRGRASTKSEGSSILVDPGIKLSCPASGSACVAVETVTAKAPASSRSRVEPKRVVIGRASFAIPAGAKHELSLSLSVSGARLLRKLGRLQATVMLVSRVEGGKAITTTRTVRITAPASKHAHG